MKPIRKAVRTFLIEDNKVLVIKYIDNNKYGYYDIPGGKIEDNEVNYQTAIRECKEETGIEINNPKFTGNLIVEYPNMIFDFDLFLCAKFKGIPQTFNENDSMWIDINDLIIQDKLFPSIELLKEDYRKYGMGTKLVNEFKNYCLENGMNEIKVTASAKNSNAINFYKKNGFDDFEVTLKMILD